MDTARDTGPHEVAVSPGAAAQLEAIRDEWLQPLVTRIEELSRQNGRLESERDQAQRERDDLQAALEQARAEQTAVDAPKAPDSTNGERADLPPPRPARRPWWHRLFGG